MKTSCHRLSKAERPIVVNSASLPMGLPVSIKCEEPTTTGISALRAARVKRKKGKMTRKRGRPKESGMEEGPRFERTAQALLIYNKARAAGEKHASALQMAAQAIRAQNPGIRISLTEVRRILAKLQPRNKPISFSVTEPNSIEAQEIRTLPNGQRVKMGPKFGFRIRPQYPRSNAKASSSAKPKKTTRKP